MDFIVNENDTVTLFLGNQLDGAVYMYPLALKSTTTLSIHEEKQQRQKRDATNGLQRINVRNINYCIGLYLVQLAIIVLPKFLAIYQRIHVALTSCKRIRFPF